VPYDWEDSIAFSNFNALTFSARKRMSGGISLAATYTYSHSIDDATSVGGNGGTSAGVVQNWQNILAEESNSSFDVRHKVSGNFVYELPFGPDTHRLTTGWFGHAVANMNFSGTYAIATGNPLTPVYEASVEDVARGTTNSLRPDRVPGVSLTAGGGSQTNWFNKDAFAAPASIPASTPPSAPPRTARSLPRPACVHSPSWVVTGSNYDETLPRRPRRFSRHPARVPAGPDPAARAGSTFAKLHLHP